MNKKDRGVIENIISKITDCINLFDHNIKRNNLSDNMIGRSGSENVTNILLLPNENGENRKITFISECSVNGKRFESTI